MSEETYTIREAFEADLPRIAALFNRHNHTLKNVERLRWKYFENPDGKTTMYVAEDADGNVIGFQGFLTRRITNQRMGTLDVLHNVDVFVASEMRGKGMYSKMAQYSMSNLIAPRISFPNELSIGFSLRDGFRLVGPFEEWLFPIAIAPLFAKDWHAFLDLVMTPLVRLYAFLWLGGKPHNLMMKPITCFERDYQFDNDLTHGVRSADYLNWRFINNPMVNFSAYEFLEGEESIGYCVFTITRSSARIFDLIVSRHYRGCLRLLVDCCRTQKVTHLSFPGIGLHLGRFGFICRDLPDKFTVFDIPENSWMITLCDRDV